MNPLKWMPLLAVTALAFGCGPTTSPYYGISSGAGGGSGNPGGTSSGGSTCAQGCQDAEVAFGVDNSMWLLYNQNLAGQPTGAQDKTVACPLGGHAHITGTTALASNNIATAHLSFDLQGCGISNATFSLTFSGQVAMDGTYDPMAPNSVTFTSPDLVLSGTVLVADNPAIHETCPVGLTDTFNHDSSQKGWLNGKVCGRITSD